MCHIMSTKGGGGNITMVGLDSNESIYEQNDDSFKWKQRSDLCPNFFLSREEAIRDTMQRHAFTIPTRCIVLFEMATMCGTNAKHHAMVRWYAGNVAEWQRYISFLKVIPGLGPRGYIVAANASAGSRHVENSISPPNGSVYEHRRSNNHNKCLDG